VTIRVVHIPAVGQVKSEPTRSVLAGLVPKDPSRSMSHWERVRHFGNTLHADEDTFSPLVPLPGVRDGCMTCFVRGIHACRVHKSSPLDPVVAEVHEEPESPVDRVDVYAIPDEPLPGWDLVRTPRSLARDLNWGQYRYVRNDGLMIYLSKSQERGLYGEWWWRPDHPVLGALGEHTAKDPQKLMRWADLKVPLIPQEDPAVLRTKRRARALRELERCR
jgi:hypothetical protein